MDEAITIKPYTYDRLDDVLAYERRLREEEDVWGWEIDDKYIEDLKKSFSDPRFDNSLSLLAYVDNVVVGRIDASFICTRFDGSKRAYLDWICVLKSYRHKGVAQCLMAELRKRLKDEGFTSLVGLIASNEEAQNYYRHIEGSFIRDEGIWIDL